MSPSTTEPLTRRRALVGLVGTASVLLLPSSAESATPTVRGRIGQTYLAAGGRAVLGDPIGAEVKQRVAGKNTYGQRFREGQVWWGSRRGKVDVPAERVRLDGAPNFRPVQGVRGVWRSDDLDDATALDRRIVRDLGVRTMIAFDGGTDPAIRSVRNRFFPISNHGGRLEFYRGYVTRSASRVSVGATVGLIALTARPVLVHCQAGKDRTGWVSDVLQRLAGVPTAVRDADYLATRRYSAGEVDLAWLQAARDQLAASYTDLDTYLVTGCGLTPAQVDAARRRLTPV